LDEFEVLYQDAGIEPMDAEAAEPEGGLEAFAHRWPFQAASPLPAVHHAPRHHHESHIAKRPERRLEVRRPGELAKRLVDIVGALTLAILLSPLLVVVGLTLARDRGPIIYRHLRTGRHGKSFGCLKFRTMVPDAEEVLRELLKQDADLRREWMRDQKLRNDPRVTAIGRFLRRTSLDELPQLWNVLKGDMSLVGPRPVVREEWARYGRRLESYLATKPGVTGLWQVMGRSDACYRRRVALDCYYVRKQNLFLDLYILLRTVKVVLRSDGAC
jgi:Undecaprenyl-phosphate galactose phosphotransferase WbaP